MRIYCTTFSPSSDWLATAGNWEQMDAYATCNRPYIIMETGEFNTLVAAAQQGGSGDTTSPQFTETEVAALKWQAASPSPFNLSISDGALVGGAIVATWAVAWGLRQLVQTLGVADGNQQE